MAMLKGETMTLVNVGEVRLVKWKQGSMLGYGGDKTQAYHECAYKLKGGCKLPVYIQVGFKTPPKSLKVDGTFQFGMNNGILFLVLHDKSQTPYQHRFMMNPMQQWTSSANEFLKMCTRECVDLSWIAGDYLRDLKK